MYKTKEQHYKAMRAHVMTKADLMARILMRGVK